MNLIKKTLLLSQIFSRNLLVFILNLKDIIITMSVILKLRREESSLFFFSQKDSQTLILPYKITHNHKVTTFMIV